MIADLRSDNNYLCPHSSLGFLIPEDFAAKYRSRVMLSDPLISYLHKAIINT